MLEQLCYRFTDYEKEMNRRARVQDYRGISPKDARKEMRDMNDRMLNRLKTDFELHEESTVADLRTAVERLTDT
jgi:hypothetical protein